MPLAKRTHLICLQTWLRNHWKHYFMQVQICHSKTKSIACSLIILIPISGNGYLFHAVTEESLFSFDWLLSQGLDCYKGNEIPVLQTILDKGLLLNFLEKYQEYVDFSTWSAPVSQSLTPSLFHRLLSYAPASTTVTYEGIVEPNSLQPAIGYECNWEKLVHCVLERHPQLLQMIDSEQ